MPGHQQTSRPSSPSRSSQTHSNHVGPAPGIHAILRMNHLIGNKAVQRMVDYQRTNMPHQPDMLPSMTIHRQAATEETPAAGSGQEEDVEMYSASDEEVVESKCSPQPLGRVINEPVGSEQDMMNVADDKQSHIQEAMGAETGAPNGHVDYWITDEVKIFSLFGTYYVFQTKLDVHSKIYIWPPGTAGRWNDIKDFGPHVGKPYDAGFNIYEGTMLHEQQHVKEVESAWNKFQPAFSANVSKIRGTSKADAKKKYDDLFKKFKEEVDKEYWKNGEADGQRVEWEYYHQQYTLYLAGQAIQNAVDAVMDWF